MLRVVGALAPLDDIHKRLNQPARDFPIGFGHRPPAAPPGRSRARGAPGPQEVARTTATAVTDLRTLPGRRKSAIQRAGLSSSKGGSKARDAHASSFLVC